MGCTAGPELPPSVGSGVSGPRGGLPQPLHGVWRLSGRPRPPASTGSSSPPGWAGPRERSPLALALDAGAPGADIDGAEPASARGARGSSSWAPTGGHAARGPSTEDPCPSQQRRHVLGVRETPRGQRAAERATRGQSGHPGASRGRQVR